MPSRRSIVAVAVLVAAVGGFYLYGELTADPTHQTFASPSNLTYPDGLGFHEESLERARSFVVDTEREVIGRAPTGDVETGLYVCDLAFCFNVAYPHDDGVSRAFYYVDPNRTIRLPHDANVRERPPDGPRQRIFLVNAAGRERHVEIRLSKGRRDTGVRAGTYAQSVGPFSVATVTLDQLDPDARYEAEYTWEDEMGRTHAFSVAFEPGNHSDVVWIFEE